MPEEVYIATSFAVISSVTFSVVKVSFTVAVELEAYVLIYSSSTGTRITGDVLIALPELPISILVL